MGDVLHVIPAAVALRRLFPEARIAWAVEAHWSPLLEGEMGLDEVLAVPLNRWRRDKLGGASRRALLDSLGVLRREAFDLAIDFQGLLKSAALAGWTGAAARLGFAREQLRESASALFYTRSWAAGGEHVVDRCLALASAAAGGADPGAVAFPLPQGELSFWLPAEDFLLASPRAGWPGKEWPPEYYAELARLAYRERGVQLVLDGGPAEEEYLRWIAALAGEGACRVHVSTLPELIGANRRARAVLGVDSGPMHLAAALSRPGVALFGPTDPARNGPYGSSLSVLRDDNVVTTYKRQTSIHPSMRALDPPRVWRALRERMDEAAEESPRSS